MKSYISEISGQVVQGISLEDLKDMHVRICKLLKNCNNFEDIPESEYDTLKSIIEPHTMCTAYDILINPQKIEKYYHDLYNHTAFEKYGYQQWINNVIRLGNVVVLDMMWSAIYACDRAEPNYEYDLLTAAKYGSKAIFFKTIRGVLFSGGSYGPLRHIYIDDLVGIARQNNRLDGVCIEKTFNKYERVVEKYKLYLEKDLAITKKEWEENVASQPKKQWWSNYSESDEDDNNSARALENIQDIFSDYCDND